MSSSILMTLSMVTSMAFLFMSHPMSMGLTLLIQTLLMTLVSGMFYLNFWYSYIMFLIMVGGMLILFIYMTSIASNEKLKISFSMAILLIILMMTMMIITMIEPFSLTTMNNIEDMNLTQKTSWKLSMIKFIMNPNNLILIMIITYLLVCLIATVKITNINYGALRQKL